jgi:hypothetical protein
VVLAKILGADVRADRTINVNRIATQDEQMFLRCSSHRQPYDNAMLRPTRGTGQIHLSPDRFR